MKQKGRQLGAWPLQSLLSVPLRREFITTVLHRGVAVTMVKVMRLGRPEDQGHGAGPSGTECIGSRGHHGVADGSQLQMRKHNLLILGHLAMFVFYWLPTSFLIFALFLRQGLTLQIRMALDVLSFLTSLPGEGKTGTIVAQKHL